MKKAFKQSKWWFYLPLISLVFLHKMSEWVFKGETSEDCGWRSIVIDLTIPLHLFATFFLLFYFELLPIK